PVVSAAATAGAVREAATARASNLRDILFFLHLGKPLPEHRGLAARRGIPPPLRVARSDPSPEPPPPWARIMSFHALWCGALFTKINSRAKKKRAENPLFRLRARRTQNM